VALGALWREEWLHATCDFTPLVHTTPFDGFTLSAQDAISTKFREMHALLDEKEEAFKTQISTLAAEMSGTITNRESECKVNHSALLASQRLRHSIHFLLLAPRRL
jgi:hypothetical protein